MKKNLLLAAMAAFFVLVAMPTASAQSGNWTYNASSTSGNWSNTSNWGNGTVPGAVSGNISTGVATFNNSTVTYGTSGSPIIIDGYRNISGLTFNGSAGNYTIGTTSGNALHMTSGGTILLSGNLTTANTTITINAPLLMYGTTTVRL